MKLKMLEKKIVDYYRFLIRAEKISVNEWLIISLYSWLILAYIKIMNPVLFPF